MSATDIVINELKGRVRELEAERDSYRDALHVQVGVLTERAERAEAKLASAEADVDRVEAELRENEGVINVWRGRTERAEAERDALRAVANRGGHLNAANAVVEQVRTDNERLRADAERYRWLRANARRIDFAGLSWTQGCELDARIDAVLAGEKP